MDDLSSLPMMVVADADGEVFEHPNLRMMGASGRFHRPPMPEEIVPMPYGADLYVLPDRHPVGIDPATGRTEIVHSFEGRPVFAVSAFLPPAYTSLLWSAFIRDHGAPHLPLYAYTCLGWREGSFVAAGVRVDPDPRQDLHNFPEGEPENRSARKAVLKYPQNRLIKHLAHCCITYRCPAARNLFLGRYEAPLPTSRTCNAACVGCISLQDGTCVPSTQDRISFSPTPEEVAEVAVGHLDKVPDGVVSFGQGCEGEPLTEGDLLHAAIKMIRERTTAGTINLNTNGSRPDILKRLFAAGLDSVRISLNSARRELYNRYFRPSGYTFEDVIRSMALGNDMGKFVSVNYFVFPGLTDEPAEADAFEKILKKTGIHMIQWRNLNIDPDMYMDSLDWDGTKDAMGIKPLIKRIHKRFPMVRFGYFNPALG
ncbi:molybdenum cofactor biosynthesis protein A [bacterium BMS3Abin14]|nr:molybdenum cofactor biosynthesis protein A [bacterium BMS3Abin14]